PPRAALPLVLLAAALAPLAPAAAQSCPGQNFFQNDSLPAQPAGSFTISVIPGLCEGEAAGAVFDLAPGSPLQVLQKVSVGFGSGGGAQGATAAVNVEVYDGVTFAGAVASLGPKVFDLAQATGANVQVTSTGINEFDLSPYGVAVGNSPSNRFVVAFRMEVNPNGSCAAGFTSNFFTDNDQPGFFGCDPAITPQQTNLIDIQGQGWRDAALATVSGFPLCPLFYSGNWVIRACATNGGPANPLQVLVAGSPAPPGGFVNLTFQAPGYAGVPYIAAASLGTSPGIVVSSGNPPVQGHVPLNPDGLFQACFSLPSVFVNFAGLVGPQGTAPGLVLLPNDPGLSGIQFHVAFVTVPPFPAPFGISDAGTVAIQ
ncbi:MAG TPA: hypothetical protein VJP77_08725, partial [Planctomycetota bacterium]|nr:hypothetical protein [Planctomycetota bacterium]